MNPNDKTKSHNKGLATSDFIDLVNDAHNLHRTGKIEESLHLAQDALQSEPQVSNKLDVNVAGALNQLGIIFFETGYDRNAKRLYKSSLNIANKLNPQNSDLLGSLYNNLGQVEARHSDRKQAKKFYEDALAIREKDSPGTLVHAVVMDNLGSTLTVLGEPDRAISLHEQALLIFERIGGLINIHVATALGNLSNVYVYQKDFQKAEAYRLRALDTHERVSGMTSQGTLIDLSCLAKLYMEMGEQHRVDRLINLLLSTAGPEPGKTHRVLAEMLNELTQTAFNNFQLDIAERLAVKAVEIYEKTEGTDSPETLAAVCLLAHVQRSTNHIGPALTNYKRALKGYNATKMQKQAADVAINLGKIYRDTDSYPVARLILDKAINQLRKLPQKDSQQIASALGNLAYLHYEEQNYPLADQYYNEALKEIKDSESNVERPWLLHNKAMLKYHLGEYELACELYKKAKEIWTDMHSVDHPFVATTASNLGLVHWAMGNIDRAVEYFSEAETLRDRGMQRILAIGSETKRVAYARSLLGDLNLVVSICLSTKPYREALGSFSAQMLLRRKGRVPDAIAHTHARVRENIQPADKAIIDRLDAIRKEISNLIAPVLGTERGPGEPQLLRKLKQEEELLEAKLSYRGALYNPALKQVTLETVQQSIPAGGTLVELLRFSVFDPERTGKKGPWKDERYAAMVLQKIGSPRWFDLGPAAGIDRQATSVLKCVRRKRTSLDKCEAEAIKLYELIVAPYQDALAETNHLFISPDGHLVLTPFGILGPGNGKRLADQLTVSYLSSGRDLTSVTDSREQRKQVAVFAAPDFESDLPSPAAIPSERFGAQGKFTPLIGAKQEGEEILQMFDQATLYTDAKATIEALKNLQRPAILHIATHGIFSPLEEPQTVWHTEFQSIGDEMVMINQGSPGKLVNPMFFSGLAMAGANKRDNGVPRGIITGQEMAGLDLRDTQLVVLSACETGQGTVKHGDEFAGLRRALAIAGAATQVTSLWKVDDDATRILMGHYYRFLLEGQGRAEALRFAQQHIEQDDDHVEWKHPFYWAAFISAGAWDPIPNFLGMQAIDRGQKKDGGTDGY